MPEEKKRLSPFTVIAGAGGSVLAMIAGSLFGVKGTIYGVAIGSIVATTGAYAIEDFSKRAHARTRALLEQAKADTEPGHYLQERLKSLPLGRHALVHAREKRALHEQDWGWKARTVLIGGMLVLCMASAFGTLFVVEAATGKTLHSSLTGNPQYGTTFGGYSTSSPSPHPSTSVVYQSPSALPSASYSPTVTPSLASPTVSISVSPSISPSPSPSDSLSVSPSYTGSPA